MQGRSMQEQQLRKLRVQLVAIEALRCHPKAAGR
jgi:hypothetical protein